MKRCLLAVTSALILACASSASAQVTFDMRIGTPPPPPRVYRVPAAPGPGYEWVEGYWYPVGRRWVWHDGYWTMPPYEGAYWIAPYYEGRRYVAGRWEGRRGDVFHNHRWDRERQRDERHEPHERRGRSDR